MEISTELVLFLIVGAVAIISAVMMLISENAVHSALFLVVNFACVAFFYLMLEAGFLAMVQVSVYAGAIMVLFLFVIMLLGAERTSPETNTRFRWLTPLAGILTAVFLLIAGIGILQSDFSTAEVRPQPALVRVINAAPALEGVSVKLGETLLAENLAFREDSAFSQQPVGAYTVSLEGDAASASLFALKTRLPEEELSLVERINARLDGTLNNTPLVEQNAPTVFLDAGQEVTLVLVALADGAFGFIPVVQDFGASPSHEAKLQVVHAFVGAPALDVAEISTPERAPRVILRAMQFGQVSPLLTKREGDYHYALYPTGAVDAALAGDAKLKVADIERLDSFDEKAFVENTSTLYIIAEPLRSGIAGQQPELVFFIDKNHARFGGPTSVGLLLFTDYMLPMQVVALLLLVAMVGAIVLTRDQVPPARPRLQRRLANPTAVQTANDPAQK
jgi:NADH-quinone oxidoreductase subunit J